MKRIIYTLLAVFSAVSLSNAQTTPVVLDIEHEYHDSGKGLVYSKTISEPDPTTGEYTITLEAFVKGNLTITSDPTPSDIVLVLDVSGSMAWPKGSYSQSTKQTYSYNDIEKGEVDYFRSYRPSNTTYREKIFAEEYDGRYYLYLSPDYETNNRAGVYLTSNGGTTTDRAQAASASSKDGVIVTPNSSNSNSFYQGTSRIRALKDAVSSFLEKINLANEYILDSDGNIIKKRTTNLHNQVAIVKFAGTTRNVIGDDSYLYSGNRTYNYTQIVVGLTDIENNVETLKSIVNGLVPRGNTNSDGGMSRANSILSGITRTSNRAVVMFTDGKPDNNDAVGTANTTKNTHDATVYTIGVFGEGDSATSGNNPPYTANEMWRYMSYVSSNYPNATGINYGGTGGNASGKYFKDASSDDVNLKDVFDDIAGEVGGGIQGEEFSEGVSTVDVVSASFKLPNGVTEDNITSFVKLYTDDYVSGYENGPWVFTESYTPITATIELAKSSATSTKKDRIEVKGFDFVENWCGPDATSDSGVHGKKLVIRIPILMDDNAVGGKEIATNGPGSGIYVNGKNQVPFENSPKVSLPINIHIRKQGLQMGESAKFTIERKLKTQADSQYKPVTSVFVTRSEGTDATGPNAPITKLVGMPATDVSQNEYVYRIVEDGWSWSYTSIPETPVTTAELRINPFIFTNDQIDDIDKTIRHAESKATNIFKTGVTNVEYDDSKDNGRGSSSGGNTSGSDNRRR